MGLDIAYFSELRVCEDQTERKSRNSTATFYENPDFPGRIGSLKEKTKYSYKSCGHYRAGSYSGYNYWRSQLCSLALDITPNVLWNNSEYYCNSPFYELIDFSDCEGTIGPEVCKKLYEDFKKFDKIIRKKLELTKEDIKEGNFLNNNVCFYLMYKRWKKAFSMASKNGAVRFG